MRRWFDLSTGLLCGLVVDGVCPSVIETARNRRYLSFYAVFWGRLGRVGVNFSCSAVVGIRKANTKAKFSSGVVDNTTLGNSGADDSPIRILRGNVGYLFHCLNYSLLVFRLWVDRVRAQIKAI